MLTGTFAGTLIANASILVSFCFIQHYLFVLFLADKPPHVRHIARIFSSVLMGLIAMMFTYPLDDNIMLDNRFIPVFLLGMFAFSFSWYVLPGTVLLLIAIRMSYGLNFGAYAFSGIMILIAVVQAVANRLLPDLSLSNRIYLHTVLGNVIYFVILGDLGLISDEWLLTYFLVHTSTTLLLGIQCQFLYHDYLNRRSLQNQAETDFLTGLQNRRMLDDFIADNLHIVKRSQGELSLAILDIDYFKQVNDTYGHEVGDKVLRKVAQIIKQNVRSYDLVGRYGGEEFMIVFPHLGKQAATEIAERIRRRVAEAQIVIDGRRIEVTVSIGISTYQESDADTIKSVADDRLYIAKHNGRNRVVYEG